MCQFLPFCYINGKDWKARGELLILKVLFVVISYTISDESKNDWKAGHEYEYAGREQRVAVGEWSIHG